MHDDKNCIFCKIISGEIPGSKVYDDKNVIAFRDIQPAAELHLLFIHKEHTVNINEMMMKHPKQLIEIFEAINQFTSENDLINKGYRIISNVGKNAGQSVFHTHFHLLSGKRLGGIN
ncbi:MAG: histidine triad nucleotide-binding protein [Bdellovibrionales bacterium RIFOXYD12_FULL_39_22]|nr:MAG: histidine triad nucleotide-binding protein [Bdellovibrionales bacterium RIFOXYB1_FULL_39_21]OFZ45213.1 MAG: histidine triad nucleotide-binding protein [Bdellovibrionales bacterium RIFOXYC12_FULL_39_17]OFZ45594.1 MAG: histidine triad nucleotide-binding protein [Bdellovibrionales bacterium RIFOXYC1_FULL_39_130]OFZ77456.1 MAG: histidine triad nucleotide-binding protein [Bdellovibrionales bacterium RIFOXYD1_FULL_39_84]OFZ91585.1 MAG: histidine triad nucleotide-binding protein [Bdellovibrion